MDINLRKKLSYIRCGKLRSIMEGESSHIREISQKKFEKLNKIEVNVGEILRAQFIIDSLQYDTFYIWEGSLVEKAFNELLAKSVYDKLLDLKKNFPHFIKHRIFSTEFINFLKEN